MKTALLVILAGILGGFVWGLLSEAAKDMRRWGARGSLRRALVALDAAWFGIKRVVWACVPKRFRRWLVARGWYA